MVLEVCGRDADVMSTSFFALKPLRLKVSHPGTEYVMILVPRNGLIKDLKREIEQTLARLFPCQNFGPIDHLRKDEGKVVLPDWYPLDPLLWDRDVVFVSHKSLVSNCASQSKCGIGTQASCCKPKKSLEFEDRSNYPLLDKKEKSATTNYASYSDGISELSTSIVPTDKGQKNIPPVDLSCLEPNTVDIDSGSKLLHANKRDDQNPALRNVSSVLLEVSSDSLTSLKSTTSMRNEKEIHSKVNLANEQYDNNEQKKKKKKKRKSFSDLTQETTADECPSKAVSTNEIIDSTEGATSRLTKERKRVQSEVTGKASQEIESKTSKKNEEVVEVLVANEKQTIELTSRQPKDLEGLRKKKKDRKRRNEYQKHLLSESSVASSNLKESGIGSDSSPVERSKRKRVLAEQRGNDTPCKDVENEDVIVSNSQEESNYEKSGMELDEAITNPVASGEDQAIDATKFGRSSKLEETTPIKKRKKHRKSEVKVAEDLSQDQESDITSFSVCKSGVAVAEEVAEKEQDGGKPSDEKDACSVTFPVHTSTDSTSVKVGTSKGNAPDKKSTSPVLLAETISNDLKPSVNTKPTFDYETDAETHHIKAKIKEVVCELIEDSDHSQSILQDPLKMASRRPNVKMAKKASAAVVPDSAAQQKRLTKSNKSNKKDFRDSNAGKSTEAEDSKVSKKKSTTKTDKKGPRQNDGSDDDDDDDESMTSDDKSSGSGTSSISFSDYETPQRPTKTKNTAKSAGKKQQESVPNSDDKKKNKNEDDLQQDQSMLSSPCEDTDSRKKSAKKRKSVSAYSARTSVSKVTDWLSQISEKVSTDPETFFQAGDESVLERKDGSFVVLETTVEDTNDDKVINNSEEIDKSELTNKLPEDKLMEDGQNEFKKPGTERRASTRNLRRMSNTPEADKGTNSILGRSGSKKNGKGSQKCSEGAAKSTDITNDHEAESEPHESPVKVAKGKKTKSKEKEDEGLTFNFDNLFEDASSIASANVKTPSKLQTANKQKAVSGFLSSADRLRFRSKVQSTKKDGKANIRAKLNKTVI